MKRILLALLIVNILSVSLVHAQSGGGGPFTAAPPPPSGNRVGGNPPTDDINPPPDPIDTPLDAGVIFLLIIGTAYGVTKMGKHKTMFLIKKAA